jgi:hypothetical protein
MKKIFILALVLSLAGTIIGQVPASFKYQAVLRDIRGNIEANTATNIIIDILQGSATGSVVYSETHSVTTDSYGLINLELGNGTATVGSISDINWNTGIYFVKVTVDGVVMGTNQLLSVPYALYSAKSANGFSGNYNDLINKPTLPNGTVTTVSGTAPLNVVTGTTSPVISMAQANGTTNGYLSSTDWTTFNNKSSFSGTWAGLSGKPTFSTVATSGSYNDLINIPSLSSGTVTSVSGTAPVNVVTGTTSPVISIAQASGTTNGFLSSTDWTTFNSKSSFSGTWADLSGKPVLATVATSGSYTDLINKPTFAAVATSGNYNDLTNVPTTNGSETIINSGTNVTITGTGTSGNPYVVNTTAHKLGDEYGGGIVFYVYDEGQHGLIAAKADLLGGQYGTDPYFQWFYVLQYCPDGCFYIYVPTGALGDGLGAGKINTSLIVASQSSCDVTVGFLTSTYGNYNFPLPDFAAKACVAYSAADGKAITYGNWYLPSKYELNLLYLSQENIATLNLSQDYYWSSTEHDEQNAWYQDFTDGTQYYFPDGSSKVNVTALVRPIRAF